MPKSNLVYEIYFQCNTHLLNAQFSEIRYPPFISWSDVQEPPPLCHLPNSGNVSIFDTDPSSPFLTSTTTDMWFNCFTRPATTSKQTCNSGASVLPDFFFSMADIFWLSEISAASSLKSSFSNSGSIDRKSWRKLSASDGKSPPKRPPNKLDGRELNGPSPDPVRMPANVVSTGFVFNGPRVIGETRIPGRGEATVEPELVNEEVPVAVPDPEVALVSERWNI